MHNSSHLSSRTQRALSSIAFLALAGGIGCEDDKGGPSIPQIEAVITCTHDGLVAPAKIECVGSYTGAPEKLPVVYAWTFGDEAEGVAPKKGKRQVHTYVEPKRYQVRLTVTLEESGATAEDTKTIVIDGAPDLSSTGVTFTPSAIDSGDPDNPLSVSFTIRNTGSAAASNSKACVLLGRNQPVTVNTAEWQLGFPDTRGLEGNTEQFIENKEFVLPPTVATGNYFVAVCADCNDDVDESEANEGNNCSKSEQPPLIVTRKDQFPDLTAKDVRPSPEYPFERADNVVVSATIQNIGERGLLGIDISVWAFPGRDAEPIFDNGILLEEFPNHLEAATPESEERVLLPITLLPLTLEGEDGPSMPEGLYTICVVVDPQDNHLELSEFNNTVCSPIPLSVQTRVVDGVDLLPCSLDAQPRQVASDGNLQISACVCNRGRIRALRHTYEFKLTPELSFDHPEAETLGVCNIGPLPAQECRICSFQGNLSAVLEPGTLGEFFVCARVDASLAIRETVEDNNDICDPRPITVGESTDIDLTISEITFGPVGEEGFECGHELDYAIMVENLAPTVASAFKVSFYLSPDDSIERTDFHLETIEFARLREPQRREGLLLVPIDVPQQVGTWFFGAIIDPDRTVDETDEGNNRAIAQEVLILNDCHGGCVDDGYEPNDSVDFAARIGVGTHEALCVGPDSGDDYYGIPLLAGESLTVNIGFDQIVGDLDLELYDASGVNLLDRSATGANQETVRVPLAASPSLYFVRVRAARPEVESRYSMTVTVNPPLDGVDLVPANLQTSPRAAIVGQEIDVQLDVLNLGLQAVGDPFEVLISVRQLGEFVLDPECADAAEGEGEGEAEDDEPCGFVLDDNGDPVNVEYELTTIEAAGVQALSSTRLQAQVVIPPEAGPGEFVITVLVDSGDAIDEAVEDNNWGIGQPIEHRVPPPDCAANEDPHEPNNSGVTAVLPPDVPEPNGPRAISNDLTVCEDFDDWWVYELEEGDELICDVTFIHGEGDIDLYLYGPDSPEPLDSSNTRDPREEVRVSGSAAGRHLLHVDFFGGGGDEPWNRYRLRCELNRCAIDEADAADEAGNDLCENATPLTADGIEDASLCTGDTDWYCIDLFAGFPVEICPEPTSGAPNDLQLLLLRGCADFVQNRGGCVQVTPRVDDTYCVKVQDSDGHIKQYDLTVSGLDGNDVGVTSLVVTPAQVLPGVRPQVTALIQNTLVQEVGTFAYEVRLSVDDEIDDDDVLIRTWRRDEPLPRGESILIDTKVDLPANVEAGEYWLGVRVIPDPDTRDRARGNNQLTAPIEVLVPCAPDARDPADNAAPGLAALAGEHRGSLCAGDTDWFAVDVGAGEDLTAVLTFDHRDGDLDLFVFAWDGAELGERLGISDGAANREVIILRDLEAGTYLVQITSPWGAENSYLLTLGVN